MKSLYVLMGSHRKNGLSTSILNEILPILKGKFQVKVEYATDKELNYCIACDKCEEIKKCIFDDEMNDIYTNLTESDNILIITPIYFNSIPSELKKIVDRCQNLYLNRETYKKTKEKKFYMLCVGGARKYDYQDVGAIRCFEHIYLSINAKFENHLLISNSDRLFNKEDNTFDLEIKNQVVSFARGID